MGLLHGTPSANRPSTAPRRGGGERQQPLPLAGDDWKVDRRTREVGRRGLADARAALAAATARAEERRRAARPSRAA